MTAMICSWTVIMIVVRMPLVRASYRQSAALHGPGHAHSTAWRMHAQPHPSHLDIVDLPGIFFSDYRAWLVVSRWAKFAPSSSRCSLSTRTMCVVRIERLHGMKAVPWFLTQPSPPSPPVVPMGALDDLYQGKACNARIAEITAMSCARDIWRPLWCFSSSHCITLLQCLPLSLP